jgi:ribosomal protein S18 acetylase RimI-like enzyme
VRQRRAGDLTLQFFPMAISIPKLATKDEAMEVVDLLCSASREIGLREHVCSAENRPKLLKWMKDECDAQRVWTLRVTSTLQGMLILKEKGILYVVVAEGFRGRGIGPGLIRHIQCRFGPPLDAEARNDRSQLMLERCGFRLTGELSSGYPILLWEG